VSSDAESLGRAATHDNAQSVMAVSATDELAFSFVRQGSPGA
jgi:hypothetical protein